MSAGVKHSPFYLLINHTHTIIDFQTLIVQCFFFTIVFLTFASCQLSNFVRKQNLHAVFSHLLQHKVTLIHPHLCSLYCYHGILEPERCAECQCSSDYSAKSQYVSCVLEQDTERPSFFPLPSWLRLSVPTERHEGKHKHR